MANSNPSVRRSSRDIIPRDYKAANSKGFQDKAAQKTEKVCETIVQASGENLSNFLQSVVSPTFDVSSPLDRELLGVAPHQISLTSGAGTSSTVQSSPVPLPFSFKVSSPTMSSADLSPSAAESMSMEDLQLALDELTEKVRLEEARQQALGPKKDLLERMRALTLKHDQLKTENDSLSAMLPHAPAAVASPPKQSASSAGLPSSKARRTSPKGSRPLQVSEDLRALLNLKARSGGRNAMVVDDDIENCDVDSDWEDDEEVPQDLGEFNLLSSLFGKRLKSGKLVKASQRVRKQVKWAHSSIKYNYCPEFLKDEPCVDTLPMPLINAGELSTILELILAGRITKELVGRCKLLIKMNYWHHRLKSLPPVVAFYSAVLREIESGTATWSSSTAELETSLLALAPRAPSEEKSSSANSSSRHGKSRKPRTLFCRDFNKNPAGCSKGETHMQAFPDGEKLVKHICSTCMLRGKGEQWHKERSPECPFNRAD